MPQSLRYVPPEHVLAVWGSVAPLLIQSVIEGGTHRLDDVLTEFEDGKAKLLIAQEDTPEKPIIAAWAIRFVEYPLTKDCVVWLSGSVNSANVEWQRLQSAIEEWAKANGCERAMVYGRDGWERKLSGFLRIGSILRKVL